MNKLTPLVAVTAIIVFTLHAAAQTLVTYNTTGVAQGTNPTSLAASNVTANITATTMTCGYGHYTNSVWVNDFGYSWNGSGMTSLANAVAGNAYFTFTITPVAGQQLNISGIDLSGQFYAQSGTLTTYYLEASDGPSITTAMNALFALTQTAATLTQ